MRALYIAGLGYIAICAALIFQRTRTHEPSQPYPLQRPAALATGTNTPISTGNAAADWFAGVRASCNALEVELRLQNSPPPADADGAGYGAACFALAGKIERARELIVALPSEQRWQAANVLFEVGHPVADAGDDRSAGPIMELVSTFAPGNYMAVYHSGASAYALGQNDIARQRLQQFLAAYPTRDGWRSNAIEMLAQLSGRP
jgi:hypothetical protein